MNSLCTKQPQQKPPLYKGQHIVPHARVSHYTHV